MYKHNLFAFLSLLAITVNGAPATPKALVNQGFRLSRLPPNFNGTRCPSVCSAALIVSKVYYPENGMAIKLNDEDRSFDLSNSDSPS